VRDGQVVVPDSDSVHFTLAKKLIANTLESERLMLAVDSFEDLENYRESMGFLVIEVRSIAKKLKEMGPADKKEKNRIGELMDLRKKDLVILIRKRGKKIDGLSPKLAKNIHKMEWVLRTEKLKYEELFRTHLSGEGSVVSDL
jgi:hypothetical protein